MRLLILLVLLSCASTEKPKLHEFKHAAYSKAEAEVGALRGANYYCSGIGLKAQVVSMTTSESVPKLKDGFSLGYLGPTDKTKSGTAVDVFAGGPGGQNRRRRKGKSC